MGKQTALVATRNDEADFLQFLRSRWNVRIFRPSAPSREEIWLDEFPAYGPRLGQLFLWNCEFPWEPDFGVCVPEAGEAAGWAYVRNPVAAPAIEFDRTNEEKYFTKDLPHIFYGRIY